MQKAENTINKVVKCRKKLLPLQGGTKIWNLQSRDFFIIPGGIPSSIIFPIQNRIKSVWLVDCGFCWKIKIATLWALQSLFWHLRSAVSTLVASVGG